MYITKQKNYHDNEHEDEKENEKEHDEAKHGKGEGQVRGRGARATQRWRTRVVHIDCGDFRHFHLDLHHKNWHRITHVTFLEAPLIGGMTKQ